jgi:DNA adenine methylase
MATPIVRWLGGKRKLLPELLKYVPTGVHTYHEPFVGGGALFFALESSLPVISGYQLSDTNPALINLYRVIAANPATIILELRKLAADHSEEAYYGYRTELNILMKSVLTASLEVRFAALALYLNKTCFNGLWRVNGSGMFNSPFGKYTNPAICDEGALWKAHEALKRASTSCVDFREALSWVRPGDLVYLDPPYIPASDTANFTAYVKAGFNLKDQEDLVKLAADAAHRGAYVIASNSDTELTRKLWDIPNFELHEVKVGRSINCKGTKRGKVGELIIVGTPK